MVERASGARAAAALIHLVVGPGRSARPPRRRPWPRGGGRFVTRRHGSCRRGQVDRTQWQLARRQSRDRPGLLVLDEVQKVPGWSEVVKGLWDADRRARHPVRVVLLGSSALLLARGSTESLAGRFFLHRCLHWSYREWRRLRLGSGTVALLRRLPGNGPPGRRRGRLAQLRPRLAHRGGPRSRRARARARDQARPPPAALRLRLPPPGPTGRLQQDARSVAGRGQHHHPGALSPAARRRLSRERARAVLPGAGAQPGLHAEAARVEQRASERLDLRDPRGPHDGAWWGTWSRTRSARIS
jgi:hypothetical protein